MKDVPSASMCRKTISTPIGWPTAPHDVSPTQREVIKRSSNGLPRRLCIGSCSNLPGLIMALSNVRSAQRAFRSSRSIRVWRAASPRRPKLAKTHRVDAPILARRGALLELEARPARSELLFELKELYVAREALVKDRTAAKNPRKSSHARAAETSEWSTPRTDRSADRDGRSGNSPIDRSERKPRRSLRHPD